jgi:hypothetical protein
MAEPGHALDARGIGRYPVQVDTSPGLLNITIRYDQFSALAASYGVRIEQPVPNPPTPGEAWKETPLVEIH